MAEHKSTIILTTVAPWRSSLFIGTLLALLVVIPATAPRPYQVTAAHAAVDAGADVVLGHHPHVLQGIERYKKGVMGRDYQMAAQQKGEGYVPAIRSD